MYYREKHKQCLPVYIITILISVMIVSCSDPAGSEPEPTEPEPEPPDTLSNEIVFVSDGGGNDDIYVMNADGTGQTQLTNNSADDGNPIISRDGTQIAFSRFEAEGPVISDPSWGIYVMYADGRGLTQLADNGADADVVEPALSPDGSKIIFLGSDGDECCMLFTVKTDGSGMTKLTGDLSGPLNPEFSPDGSRIVFADSDGNDWEIFIMNADGSELLQLTDNSTNDLGPTFSPDGSKVAYSGWDGTHRYGDQEIFLMNPDGSEKTNLTDNPIVSEGDPVFSPDGSKIAFHHPFSNSMDIYIMNSDGSGRIQLTKDSPLDSNPVFSPDGTKIAFSSYDYDREDSDIYVVNADGSGPIINLTDNASSAEGGHDWSPVE